ncbi:MAG: hypothetical protein AAFX52_12065 [Pseudomonadota bacterium]
MKFTIILSLIVGVVFAILAFLTILPIRREDMTVIELAKGAALMGALVAGVGIFNTLLDILFSGRKKRRKNRAEH